MPRSRSLSASIGSKASICMQRGEGVSLQALLVPLAGVGTFQESHRQSDLGVVHVLGSSQRTSSMIKIVESVILGPPKNIHVLWGIKSHH